MNKEIKSACCRADVYVSGSKLHCSKCDKEYSVPLEAKEAVAELGAGMYVGLKNTPAPQSKCCGARTRDVNNSAVICTKCHQLCDAIDSQPQSWAQSFNEKFSGRFIEIAHFADKGLDYAYGHGLAKLQIDIEAFIAEQISKARAEENDLARHGSAREAGYWQGAAHCETSHPKIIAATLHTVRERIEEYQKKFIWDNAGTPKKTEEWRIIEDLLTTLE